MDTIGREELKNEIERLSKYNELLEKHVKLLEQKIESTNGKK